jgi:hypothetical protein
MRGVSLLLDHSDKISYESAKGFWWDGELLGIYFEDNYLGDLQSKLSLFDVIKGRSIFFIKLEGPTINLKGRLGRSLLGTYFIEDLNFSLISSNTKKLNTPISSVTGSINQLLFSRSKCLKAKGRAEAKVLDLFGIFSEDLYVQSSLKCKGAFLELKFNTINPKNLKGTLLISPSMKYTMEASSERVSSKIKELSKFRLGLDPSINAKGNLVDLIDYL